MDRVADLRVVRLTSPGRGAVASVLVEGPGAAEVVRAKLRIAGEKSLEKVAADRVLFGHLELDGGIREEVVVRRRADGAVEVHCHGGHAAVAAVEGAIVEAGGTPLGWREWVREHEPDAIAAAARVALADVRTERTALILLDQYHGALGRAVEEIRELLRGGEPAEAGRRIDELLARAELGRHLVEPWRVVLAGPPNVGKSSLINALVGYQRAIVHATPGTTRDVVTVTTAVDGWPVELSDTAGLREGEHELERAGVELARGKLAAADLAVLVFDLTRPWTPGDAELAEKLPSAVTVHNKCDLPAAPGAPRPEGLRTSALSGEGIDRLVETIAHRLVPAPPPLGAPVPFTPKQVAALQSAARALTQDNAAALTALAPAAL